MKDRSTWDREVDLLVCGAGAGGMSAAIVAANEGLAVMICEKTAQVGGTTATSGGAVWVPGNTQSRKTTAPDTADAGRRYLDEEVGAFGDPQVREAFLQHGPTALDYLEQHSEVKLKSNNPYPDYHAEKPGGALGGRTCAPLPFDGRKLGADFALLRPPMPEFMVLGGMMVGRDEIKHLVRPWRSWTSFRLATRLVAQYLKDRIRYRRGTRLLLGNALAGRLLYSLKQKGVEVVVNAALVELVRDGKDVFGAVIDVAGKRTRVRALRGVVLATGGCAASARWRAAEVKHHAIPHALALECASGDGLDAGVAVGGAINRNHATPFFWMPASIMRWPAGRVATYPHIRDRPKPGLIAVNAAGRRFVNEGSSYHDFVAAMFESDRSVRTVPAYLICDRDFIRDYGLGVIHPVWQWLPKYLKAGYLACAPSLEELAQKIGVDAGGLMQSIGDYNRDAAQGMDRAFGKGSFALNRHNGDPDNQPNPCLRPIVRAPFFALAVHPAPLGSSIGLRTNVHAQVLDDSGAPINGLYACGNDMSSIMGGAYPGPGITLGPALVFGFCAAMHAVRKGRAEPVVSRYDACTIAQEPSR